jgi:hypothetical protein
MSDVTTNTEKKTTGTPWNLRSLVTVGEPEFLGRYIKERVKKAYNEMNSNDPDYDLTADFIDRYVNNENPLADNGVYRIGRGVNKDGADFIFAKRLAPINKTRLEEFQELKEYGTLTEEQYEDPMALRLNHQDLFASELKDVIYSWFNTYLETDRTREEDAAICDTFITLANDIFFRGKHLVEDGKQYYVTVFNDGTEEEPKYNIVVRPSKHNQDGGQRRNNDNNRGGKKFNKRR